MEIPHSQPSNCWPVCFSIQTIIRSSSWKSLPLSLHQTPTLPMLKTWRQCCFYYPGPSWVCVQCGKPAKSFAASSWTPMLMMTMGFYTSCPYNWSPSLGCFFTRQANFSSFFFFLTFHFSHQHCSCGICMFCLLEKGETTSNLQRLVLSG